MNHRRDTSSSLSSLSSSLSPLSTYPRIRSQSTSTPLHCTRTALSSRATDSSLSQPPSSPHASLTLEGPRTDVADHPQNISTSSPLSPVLLVEPRPRVRSQGIFSSDSSLSSIESSRSDPNLPLPQFRIPSDSSLSGIPPSLFGTNSSFSSIPSGHSLRPTTSKFISSPNPTMYPENCSADFPPEQGVHPTAIGDSPDVAATNGDGTSVGNPSPSSHKRKSETTALPPTETKKPKTNPQNGSAEAEGKISSDSPAPRGSGRVTSEKGRLAYNRARSQQAKVMAASPLPVTGGAAERPASPEAATSQAGQAGQASQSARPAPCHQHRRFCGRPMLQCTNMRDRNQRCRLWYCDYALRVYYGLSREDILARGRDSHADDPSKTQTDLNPDEMCPASDAAYLFVCPRCAGTCECSVCRHRRGLAPLAHTDKGHDLLAQARQDQHDSSLSLEEADVYMSKIRAEESNGNADKTKGTTKAKGKTKAKVADSDAGSEADAEAPTTTKKKAPAKKATTKKATGTKAATTKATGTKAATTKATGTKSTRTKVAGTKAAKTKVTTTKGKAKPKTKAKANTEEQAGASDKEQQDKLMEGVKEENLEEGSPETPAKGKKKATGTKTKAEPKKTTKAKAAPAKTTKATTTRAKSSTTKSNAGTKTEGKAKPKDARKSGAKAEASKATPAKGQKSATKDAGPKIKPKPVVAALELQEAPLTGLVRSPLPTPNLSMRMWIYEGLVRFDAVPTPAMILRRLDKFDDWNPRMLKQILEAATACLAGTSLKQLLAGSKPPTSSDALPGSMPLVRAVRMLHDAPDALARGEAWEAARQWLETEQVVIEELPDVEHSFIDEIEDRGITPASDVPIAPGTSRRVLTRAGRAKMNNIDVPRKNLREASVHSDMEDERAGGVGDDDDKEFDASAQSPEPPSGDEAFNENAPESAVSRSRRSGREAKSAQDAYLGWEIRRSGRARRDQSQTENTASRQASTAPVSAAPSVVPEDDRTEHPEAPAPIQERAAQEPTPVPAPPVLAPPFEQRVAILGALVNDFVPRTNAVRSDMLEAFNKGPAADRDARADIAKVKADHKERMEAINAKLATETNQRYLEELNRKKSREERNLAWILLSRNVQFYNHVNRTKMRSGPLGVDADGREYWQLTEYSESMPKVTEGRWAWGLYIYGKPFAHPSTMAELSVEPEPATTAADGVANGEAQVSQDNVPPTPNVTAPSSAASSDNRPSTTSHHADGQTDATKPVEPLEPPALSVEAQAWAHEKFVLDQEPRWQMINWPYWIFQTIKHIKYRVEVLETDEKRAREWAKWHRSVSKAETEAINAAPSKKSKTRASFSAAGAPSLPPGGGPRWAATAAAGVVSLGQTQAPAGEPDVTGISDSNQSDADEVSTSAAQAKIDKLEEAVRLSEAAYEEMRKARRVSIDELCQRLDKVMDYFMFHLGFVERSEVQNLS